MRDHESKDLSAALSARSTSPSSASTTSDNFCSVAGLMVGNRFLLCGATILPPMKSPYRGSILMWSIDSGAGAYSNVCLARSVAWRFAMAMSVDGEVVARLVHARALFLDLHQYVVEQSRCAQAKSIWRHPVGAQRLVEDYDVCDCLLRGADPAGGPG